MVAWVGGLLLSFSVLPAAGSPATFATPEEAVTALAAAIQPDNAPALRTLFGSEGEELVNPDPVQGGNELLAFAAAFNESHRLVHDSDSLCTLVVGQAAWPFPIPLRRQDGRWSFDAAAGREEILNRRIGRNELDTLAAVRAFVVAQREYAARDRNGDGVLEFAQRLMSSPDQKDGLYWSPDLDGEISPLGPLVAQAQAQGYERKAANAEVAPEPFHGYFFKILLRQGKSAPGGEYRYVLNGHLIAGFALVAWPAEYGSSGVMTFIVNQQGRVYQKDLGPDTAKQAAALETYDPEKSWSVSAN